MHTLQFQQCKRKGVFGAETVTPHGDRQQSLSHSEIWGMTYLGVVVSSMYLS